jgi:ribosomal protein S21
MERIQQILDGASSSSLLTPTTKAKPSSPPRPGPPPSPSSTLNLNLKVINDKEALNLWDLDSFVGKYKMPPKKEIELRTKVPLGRTINITRGMDAAAAIHKLNVQVARNKVHQEWRARKFYERPALRRKRLRLERKEARFAESVRAAIGRTMKLRQMGW